MPRKRDPKGQFVAQDFWENVEKSPTCWLWTGAKHSGKWPYAQFRYHGRAQYVHRIAWMLTYGPILPGFLVLHACDNPPCVRPSHLFLGTASDNTRDAIKKGRWSFPPHPGGEASSHAKLTWEQVREIRRLYAQGNVTQKHLGALYNVDQKAIFFIVHHKTWKE